MVKPRQNETWRNHYVPQLYLNLFSDPELEKPWVTEILHEGGEPTSVTKGTKYTGFQEHLYLPEVEHYLRDKIETPVMHTLGKLLQPGTDLDRCEQVIWCRFVVALLMRHPQMIAAGERLGERRFPGELEKIKALCESDGRPAPEGLDDIMRNSIKTIPQWAIKNFVTSGPHVPRLMGMQKRRLWIKPTDAVDLWTTDLPLLMNPGIKGRSETIHMLSIALSPGLLFMFHEEGVNDEVVEYVAHNHNRLLLSHTKWRPTSIYSSRKLEPGKYVHDTSVLQGLLTIPTGRSTSKKRKAPNPSS